MVKIINDNDITNLDVFQRIFTFYDKTRPGRIGPRAGKICMLIPIIAQIVAPLFFVDLIIKNKEPVEKRIFIAVISRCALSFFATPLLFLVDLVGTAIASCLAARHTQRLSVMGPR